jgi:hypothetical protein
MTENNLDRLAILIKKRETTDRELKTLYRGGSFLYCLLCVTLPVLIMFVRTGREYLSNTGFAILDFLSFFLWFIIFFLAFGLGTINESKRSLTKELKTLQKQIAEIQESI